MEFNTKLCLFPNCNNLVKRKRNKYCSISCSSKANAEFSTEKKKKTNLEKYGVENVFQIDEIKGIIKYKKEEIWNKIEQTNLEKYGVKAPSQSKEIQEKIKQTNIKKYGVDNPLKNKEIHDKQKQTNLERYGVETPFQNKEIKNKIKNSNLKVTFDRIKEKFKDKIEFLFSLEEYLGGKVKEYQLKCLSCNSVFEGSLKNGLLPRCVNCFPYLSRTSQYEKQVSEYLTSLNISFEEKNRNIIPPLELDIYIPDYKLAIEFNGLYWHSELNGKGKYYHLDKTNKCLEKGIQLIHIFEDEWVNKQDIVKSVIKNKLGLNTKIYARKTEFKSVTKKEAKKFLNSNHLQGYNQQIKYCFGLYFENQLVELVTIGCSRYNKNYDYELNRSGTKLNTSVIGGFEKLMKNLPLQGKIISYVDHRYFNGNSYKEWSYVDKTNPNYFYQDKEDYSKRISRITFQKHKLPKLFPDVYDINLTEWEIMQLAGYDRIWDCGNLVYSRILYNPSLIFSKYLNS